MNPLIGADDPEVPVWASYTDVAMNVLVVLLLYLFTQAVYSTMTETDMVLVRQEQQQMRDSVMDALPAELKNDVTVAEDGQLMRYRFADQVLFDSGDANLKDSGKTILSIMGRVFQSKALVGSSTHFSHIQVEGHTDDIRIHNGSYGSNWELSSARATSVVQYLADDAGLDPKLLSATGYSQYRPLADNDSDLARAHNRRIEVVVVYSIRSAAAIKK
jgi:chemotaxis protein MotB